METLTETKRMTLRLAKVQLFRHLTEEHHIAYPKAPLFPLKLEDLERDHKYAHEFDIGVAE